MRVYLDSCLIIYLIEGIDEYRKPVAYVLHEIAGSELCVTDLSRMECRIKPLRIQDQSLLQEYDDFFLNSAEVLSLSNDVFDLAAAIRARQNLKTPDAIHLAAAVYHGCDEFWTNDTRLAHSGVGIVFRAIP